jgi:hypothetical protein
MMRSLPLDKHGRIVPWFVAWPKGQPDHRIIDTPKISQALRFRRCWICGGPLGTRLAFLIGPMCVVNRTTAEPPSHTLCAVYSAQVCPFLTTPVMSRRPHGLEGYARPVGMLHRNPGASAVWVTRSFSQFDAGEGRPLFTIGGPLSVLWFTEGREASRAEVLASLDAGVPALREVAEQSGPEDVAALDGMYREALRHLPPLPFGAGQPAGAALDPQSREEHQHR